MNTKQIIDEMVRTLAARTWSADHKGTFVHFLDGVESVVNPAVRKLIESLAEEIIPMNFEYCDSCQALGVENFGGWCSFCKDALNANRRYNQQRLKVKEIINQISK